MFVVIKDFTNYSISDEGIIINNKTGRILKGGLDQDGYRQVILCNKGLRRNCRIHREVALTFLPNPNNFPVINHIDGIKTNNNLSNLEWCTISHNTKHAYKMNFISQKGERNNSCIYTDEEVKNIINNYKGTNITSYSKELNIPYSVVYSYIKGLRRSSTTIP